MGTGVERTQSNVESSDLAAAQDVTGVEHIAEATQSAADDEVAGAAVVVAFALPAGDLPVAGEESVAASRSAARQLPAWAASGGAAGENDNISSVSFVSATSDSVGRSRRFGAETRLLMRKTDAALKRQQHAADAKAKVDEKARTARYTSELQEREKARLLEHAVHAPHADRQQPARFAALRHVVETAGDKSASPRSTASRSTSIVSSLVDHRPYIGSRPTHLGSGASSGFITSSARWLDRDRGTRAEEQGQQKMVEEALGCVDAANAELAAAQKEQTQKDAARNERKYREAQGVHAHSPTHARDRRLHLETSPSEYISRLLLMRTTSVPACELPYPPLPPHPALPRLGPAARVCTEAYKKRREVLREHEKVQREAYHAKVQASKEQARQKEEEEAVLRQRIAEERLWLVEKSLKDEEVHAWKEKQDRQATQARYTRARTRKETEAERKVCG